MTEKPLSRSLIRVTEKYRQAPYFNIVRTGIYTYQGGSIVSGVLVGTVNEDGTLHFRYHHVSKDGSMRSGSCNSTPKQLDNGKIQLFEKWKWMDGDQSDGESVIVEQ